MFQLQSDNADLFKPMTILLSTVETTKTQYESCVFSGVGSEVVETYYSLTDAIIGHQKWAKQLGLSC